MRTAPRPRGRVIVRVAAVAALFVAAGCTEPTTPRAHDSVNASVIPLCQLGCVGQDPDPSAPGVYISSITPNYCFNGGGNDQDYDGVTDLCETWLATTFDPQMAFSNADNVGREPRFAVRQSGPRSVLIAYAISYYVDLGTQDPLCETYFTASLCRGHYGDSEALYFTVTYDPETQHWVLTTAVLSQHDGSQTLTSSHDGYVNALTYPSHPGAYPRIYPSFGKHANYPDPSSCQSGLPHLDACIPPYTYARLGTTGSAQNLGSNAHRLLDCVTSTNRFYSANPPECYWSGARFDGWQDALPDADPYGPKLQSFGF